MKRTLLLSSLTAALLVPAPLALATSAPSQSKATSIHATTEMHSDIAGGAVGSVRGIVKITTSSQYCTGAVIAPKIVLTAAHCLEDVGKASTIGVRVNDTNQSLAVARYVRAPGFDPTTHQNDAAVLILKSAAHTPSLPVSGAEPQAGTGAMITGYGQHTYASSVAHVAFSAGHDRSVARVLPSRLGPVRKRR